MRTQKIVTMANIYQYEAPAFGYGYETRYIYKMVSEDGTVYVWKTTSLMYTKAETDNRSDACEYDSVNDKWYKYFPVNKGDIIKATFTEKGESEYNGERQMLVNRVKIDERISKAKSAEEIAAEKKAAKEAQRKAQLDTMSYGDFIWRMPYKQYKDHYSDCETVIDSFERDKVNGATIEVIIREGRLKASGVRGHHYRGFCFKNEEGFTLTYRAINVENAIKRIKKEYPGKQWMLEEVFDYCNNRF